MSLLQSWVASANSADTPFPLNNLPYGVFDDGGEDIRCGVAIGDMILDVTLAEEEGVLELPEEDVFAFGTWDLFMDLGPKAWEALGTGQRSTGGSGTTSYRYREGEHAHALQRCRIH
jgi:fumarylacetoacetase